MKYWVESWLDLEKETRLRLFFRNLLNIFSPHNFFTTQEPNAIGSACSTWGSCCIKANFYYQLNKSQKDSASLQMTDNEAPVLPPCFQ